MDESTQDPTFTPEATADNPVQDDGAPIEQGQGTDPDFAERFDPSSLDEALQEQYRSMRGDYTRKTQSLAEERKAFEQQTQEHQNALDLFQALQEDPHATLQQLQELFAEGTDDEAYEYDPDDDNPETQLLSRLEQQEQRLQQFEAQQQAEQHQRQMLASMTAEVEQINQLRDKAGEQPITSDELDEIVKFTVPDERGNVPLLSTYQALAAFFDRRQQAYIAGKRAPTPPGQGTPGSQKLDIKNEDQRLQHMKAILDGSLRNQ